jgi:outer membrane lipase/esterase
VGTYKALIHGLWVMMACGFWAGIAHAQRCSPTVNPDPVRTGQTYTVTANCAGVAAGNAQHSYSSSGLGVSVTGAVSPATFGTSSGRPSGVYTILVSNSSNNSSGSVNFNYISGGQLAVVSGNNQTGTAGQALPALLRVRVLENGVPLAGEPVYWSTYDTASGTASLQNVAITQTDASGNAQLNFVVPNTSPGRVVSANIGTLGGAYIGGSSAVDFNLTINPTPGAGSNTAPPTQPDQQRATAQALAVAQTTLTTVQTQLTSVQNRIRYLRFQGNAPGFRQDINVNVGGRNLPIGGSGGSGSSSGSSGNSDRTDGGSAGSSEQGQSTTTSRWGAYITGGVNVAQLKRTETQPGFDLDTNGMTFGADYRISRAFVMGAAVGALKSDTELIEQAGAQKSRGGSVTGYFSYAPTQATYIDVAVSAARNQYDLTRLQSVGGYALANTRGKGLGVTMTGGIDFRFGSLTLAPYVRADYLRSEVDAFTEQGAGALQLSAQKLTSSVYTVGTQLQNSFSTSAGIFIPHLRLELQRQSQNTARAVTAQLLGSSTQVLVDQSAPVDKSFGQAGLGVSAQFSRGLTGFLDYEQLFGKENLTEKRFTTGLKAEF